MKCFPSVFYKIVYYCIITALASLYTRNERHFVASPMWQTRCKVTMLQCRIYCSDERAHSTCEVIGGSIHRRRTPRSKRLLREYRAVLSLKLHGSKLSFAAPLFRPFIAFAKTVELYKSVVHSAQNCWSVKSLTKNRSIRQFCDTSSFSVYSYEEYCVRWSAH